MSISPGPGETEYVWTPAVQRIVTKVLRRFPHVSANTYEDHPWPSWDRYSVDFWDIRGRGYPIDTHTGYNIRRYLMDMPGYPLIRHTIYIHSLWTSWGGYSYWPEDDHSKGLRHLHVTYWK